MLSYIDHAVPLLIEEVIKMNIYSPLPIFLIILAGVLLIPAVVIYIVDRLFLKKELSTFVKEFSHNPYTKCEVCLMKKPNKGTIEAMVEADTITTNRSKE